MPDRKRKTWASGAYSRISLPLNPGYVLKRPDSFTGN
jgi:hypothetical protein